MITFEICTARIAYSGVDRLDITAGAVHKFTQRGGEWKDAGEGRLFAPPGWLPAYLKKKRIDSGEYTKYYHKFMTDRYAALAQEYQALIIQRVERGDNRIVLCCYCAAGAFCHRRLAREYLYKIACSIPALRESVTFIEGDELVIPARAHMPAEQEELPLW